jgi:hypothetical protein
LVFEKNANFFAENWEKSQKIDPCLVGRATDTKKVAVQGTGFTQTTKLETFLCHYLIQLPQKT